MHDRGDEKNKYFFVVWRLVPRRTSYVCASFAIDRFGAFASRTAASVRNKTVVESLSSSDLRSATWELVRRSHGVEAALLVHLLRHRIPDGDLAMIFERALDVFIEQVKKERFATGRKARQAPAEGADASPPSGPDPPALCRAHNQHAAEQM